MEIGGNVLFEDFEVSLSLYDTVVDGKLNEDLFKFSKRAATKAKKKGKYNKKK